MRDYDKALKKLAGQIAHAIKIDTTYRDIPFGAAQLDIHSDGKTVLLAVKILNSSKDSFKVHEFQMPASKLRKFLIGAEIRELLYDSYIKIFFNEEKIVNQVSQGIAKLVRDSKKKNETWIFPFHNHFIAFKKEPGSIHSRGLAGRITSIEVNSNNPVEPFLFPVSGSLFSEMKDFVKPHFVHESVEFRIYRVLTRNSITLPSPLRYCNNSESSMHLEAA